MSPVDYMSADLVRMAFVSGMVLNVFLYEKSHLTTGSIVVPGFLGIHFLEPGIILAVLVNPLICFSFVHRICPKFVLMSAKQKFSALIVVSVVIQVAWSSLATIEMPIAITGAGMSELGYVLPGLIAHDMSRNGPSKTALNTIFASYVVGAFVYAMLKLLPTYSLNRISTEPITGYFDLVFVLAASTFGSLLIKLKTPIRGAGYVTAAYLVFFCTAPLIVVVILMSAIMTYVFCSQVLIPSMIIFGRRKFALVLTTGAIFMWALIFALESLGFDDVLLNHPLYAGILILLPGLIANEIDRAGVSAVTLGLSFMILWILTIAELYQEIQSFHRPNRVLPLVALLAALIGGVLVASRIAEWKIRHHAFAKWS